MTLPLDQITWPEKYPAERVTAAFDFSPSLAAGDSVASVTINVTTVLGVDATPNAIKFGSAVIKGARVYQQLAGGLAGCSYLVVAQATTVQNNIVVIRRILPVVPLI